MRENRTCGSEGGEGVSPSRPLSVCRSAPKGLGQQRVEARLGLGGGGGLLGLDGADGGDLLAKTLLQVDWGNWQGKREEFSL